MSCLPAPRLSKYDFPHGQERLLGFVETVTFSPGKDSAQGAGALPRADPLRWAFPETPSGLCFSLLFYMKEPSFLTKKNWKVDIVEEGTKK